MADSGERDIPAAGRAGKRLRVRQKRDIDRVFAAGRRVADGRLTLFAVTNSLPWSRAGVGVSRKHGGAVRRNRVKRLCREAFRLVRAELPTGLDFMLIPRAGVAHTLADLQDSLRKLGGRLGRQLAAGPDEPDAAGGEAVS